MISDARPSGQCASLPTITPRDRTPLAQLLESWAQPTEAYQISPGKAPASLALAAPFPFDLSAIVVDRIEAKAPDGTIMPVDVLHLKGQKLDGSAPTLLD